MGLLHKDDYSQVYQCIAVYRYLLYYPFISITASHIALIYSTCEPLSARHPEPVTSLAMSEAGNVLAALARAKVKYSNLQKQAPSLSRFPLSRVA